MAHFAVVRRLAFLALLLGAATIAGWAFNLTLFKSGVAGLAAMQPLTAVGIMLCALALGASTSQHKYARVVVVVCAGSVLLLVASILVQNALDTDWGTDRLLFPNAVANEQTGPFLRAGRPAGAAMVALGLLGVCLLMISGGGRLARRTYVLLATAGTVGATSLLLAYTFILKPLYVMGLYVQVALNTGIGFALLFMGLLLRRSDLGPMKYLCGDSIGAVSTRRLLSWTVAVLIVLGGIVQFGTHASWYRAELELALVTLAGIGVLFAGLLSHARRIDTLDRTRRGIAEQLHTSESRELQIARALAESQQRKHQFLTALAHELRNPLAPLRNGLHILRLRAGDDERLKPTVTMMERQLNELARAIDVLLDEYSREPSDTPLQIARSGEHKR